MLNQKLKINCCIQSVKLGFTLIYAVFHRFILRVTIDRVLGITIKGADNTYFSQQDFEGVKSLAYTLINIQPKI